MTVHFHLQIVFPPGKAELCLEHWRRSSAVIQRMPGARGTRMKKKVGEDNSYLAIATWDSVEARESALEALKDPAHPHYEERWRWTKDEELGQWTLLGIFSDEEDVLPPAS